MKMNNRIEYEAGLPEEVISREILHKMLDGILDKMENGENLNTARTDRPIMDDEGNIRIKEYYIKVNFGERPYGD